MESVRVPQHLELEDVLVWSLSASDLLWTAGGLLAGWWLFLHLPALLPVRAAVAAPEVVVGLLLGPARLGERPLRSWLGELAAFAARPRLRVYGGSQ